MPYANGFYGADVGRNGNNEGNNTPSCKRNARMVLQMVRSTGT